MSDSLSFAFVHLFELILITGLLHYHRRLRLDFLQPGAIALTLHIAVESFFHLGLMPRETTAGIWVAATVELGFALLMLGCASRIVDREMPRGVVWGSGAALALAAIAAAFSGPTLLASLLPGAPAAFVLVVASFQILRVRSAWGLGTLWFSGVVGILALGVLVLPVLAGPGMHLVIDLVHLLIGLTLMMIISERMIADLASQAQRIERYAEDRKRLELQFSHAQKLESLGVLAGGIAHDFNNMLTSILGYASLAIKKLPNDSDVRKDLYMVMSGARQAVDLTSQMLIYAGKGALEFESADLSKVVENMGSLINSIVPRKVQLQSRLGRDLPSIKGDKVQLGQVVMNLIANAVDAIEDGSGTVEVATGLADVDSDLLRVSFFAEQRSPGAYLFLRVRDTGIGMSEEQVEKIFDPFYTEKHSGRGLGLASLSGIVRQHNGFIHVRSSPGEGSEFTVYFPALAVTDNARPAPMPGSREMRARGRVLLADDDPRIRSLMASILESDRFSPVAAEDGREALSIYREYEGEFDLLVIDCTMPKLSGTEFYKQLRSEGVDTPIVLVSGYHQEQVAKNIESDPNGRFIKKPFNVDDFLQEVHEALTSRRVAR